MADAQTRSYTLYIDNTEADKALKRFQKTAAALEKEIKEIEAAGGDATKQVQKLANTRAGIESLEKSLKSGLQKSFRDLQNDVRKVENQLKRATDPAIVQQLNSQLDVAKRKMLEYEATVLKVGRAQKQLANENSGWLTRMFGGAKDAFVGAFSGNIIAQGITNLVSGLQAAAQDAWRLGREAIGVRRAFNALNDPQLLGELRAATRGAVSDLELMKAAVNANNFQIPLKTLGTLLEFAQRRAKETGQSVDYLVQSIVTGIARKSPLILDNLGINIQRIQEEFKKTGDFATAATNVVNEELSKMGQTLGDIDTRLDRQSARWDNIKEKVGGFALSVVDALSNTAILGFGDEASKRQVVEERIQQEILDAKEKFRAEEIEALNVFNAHYLKQTEEGQALLKESAKAALEDMLLQEKTAWDIGGAELQGRLAARIEIWRDYLGKLSQTAAPPVETLGSIKNELSILQEQMDGLAVGSKELAANVARQKELQKQINDALGQTDEAAFKKLQRENERSAERLAAFLKKNAQEIAAFNLSQYEKEIQAVHNKYAEFEKAAKKGSEVEILLAQQKAAEIANINKRVANEAQKNYEESQRQLAVLRKEQDEQARQERLGILAAARNSARGLAGQMEKSIQGLATADLINADLKVRKAGLLQRLRAEKEYLKLQHQQEQEALQQGLKSGELTHAEYLARRAESDFAFREASYQAEVAHYQRVLDQVSSFVSSALGLFETYAQAKKAEEDAELERDKKNNEQEKKNLKAQLDSKLITREQYDQRVTALDKKLEQKEKELRLRQFKREKAINITKAIMGTAQAVVQALTAGPIIGAVLAALYGAMGAAQIATIAAQKPPEMARGGKLKGPSHDSPDKGMPVTDPRTGKVQAYLEGDEGIVKKSAMRSGRVYTLSGTPSSITSTLNSMYGGVSWDKPATLAPAWTSYQPRQVDFPAMQDTIKHVRMFADGGQFQATAPSPPPSAPVVQTDPLLIAMIQQNTQAVNALSAVVSRGIRASVYLDELNDQQARLDNLHDDATFRA